MSKLDNLLKGAEYGFGQMALKPGSGSAVPGVYKRAIKKLMLELIDECTDQLHAVGVDTTEDLGVIVASKLRQKVNDL